MPSRERGHLFMAYIRGEAREQTTMFPATLDELIPLDHMCRNWRPFFFAIELPEACDICTLIQALADRSRPRSNPPARPSPSVLR